MAGSSSSFFPMAFVLSALTLLGGLSQASAQELRPLAKKASPEERMQAALVKLIKRIRPAAIAIGGGSGVIISEDGWVLTNHHVAGDETRTWTIRLPGGKLYDAKITGRDVIGDITLLKIDTKDKLPFMPLADSDKVKAGDWVLAMGNPWGYAGQDALPTVSLGTVNAVHRYQDSYGDAIQTDAPINPGNSGGPLINMKGEVIGINGRIAFRFGQRSNTGIGFAIPANQIKKFLPKLKAAKGGRVDHGEVPGLVLDKKPKHLTGGARIKRVIPKTASAKIGLKAEDRVVAVDGVKVSHVWRFLGVVSTYPVGTEVTLTVVRGDKSLDFKVSLIQGKSGGPTDEGVLKPGPESPFLGLEPGVTNMKGLQIYGVWESSPADLAGIRAGDSIVKMDGRPVTDGWEYRSYISGLPFGRVVRLVVNQGGIDKKFELKVGNSSDYPFNKFLTLPKEGEGKKSKGPGAYLGFKAGDRGDDGVEILTVDEKGPAAKAGMKAGDELLSLNGKDAEDIFQLEDIMSGIKEGQKVKVEIFRDGRLMDLVIVAGAKRKKQKKSK